MKIDTTTKILLGLIALGLFLNSGLNYIAATAVAQTPQFVSVDLPPIRIANWPSSIKGGYVDVRCFSGCN